MKYLNRKVTMNLHIPKPLLMSLNDKKYSDIYEMIYPLTFQHLNVIKRIKRYSKGEKKLK